MKKMHYSLRKISNNIVIIEFIKKEMFLVQKHFTLDGLLFRISPMKCHFRLNYETPLDQRPLRLFLLKISLTSYEEACHTTHYLEVLDHVYYFDVDRRFSRKIQFELIDLKLPFYFFKDKTIITNTFQNSLTTEVFEITRKRIVKRNQFEIQTKSILDTHHVFVVPLIKTDDIHYLQISSKDQILIQRFFQLNTDISHRIGEFDIDPNQKIKIQHSNLTQKIKLYELLQTISLIKNEKSIFEKFISFCFASQNDCFYMQWIPKEILNEIVYYFL